MPLDSNSSKQLVRLFELLCTFNVIGYFGEFPGNGSFADIPTHMVSAITFDSDILVNFKAIIARRKTILKGYKIALKFL